MSEGGAGGRSRGRRSGRRARVDGRAGSEWQPCLWSLVAGGRRGGPDATRRGGFISLVLALSLGHHSPQPRQSTTDTQSTPRDAVPQSQTLHRQACASSPLVLPGPPPALSSPSLNPRSRWPSSHRSTRLDPATGSLRRPRPLAPAELQARSHDGPRFPLRRPARPQQARSVPPSPSPASSPMDRRAHSRCPHRHVRPVRRGPARPRQGERQTSRPHHLDHRQPGRPRAPQSPGASCSSHSSSRPVSPSGHR